MKVLHASPDDLKLNVKTATACVGRLVDGEYIVVIRGQTHSDDPCKAVPETEQWAHLVKSGVYDFLGAELELEDGRQVYAIVDAETLAIAKPLH